MTLGSSRILASGSELDVHQLPVGYEPGEPLFGPIFAMASLGLLGRLSENSDRMVGSQQQSTLAVVPFLLWEVAGHPSAIVGCRVRGRSQ